MRNIFTKVTKPRNSYFKVGERQKMKTRADLRYYYKLISSDFEKKYGLQIKQIELIDKTREINNIELIIINNHENLSKKSIDIYKTKEKTNLSDKAFQQFYESGADFPTLFTTKKYQLRLNSAFKVFKNSKGYYFNPGEKILFYLSIFKNYIKMPDDLLRIRIAADGTQIGKHLTVLNISFSFLNEIEFPKNKSKH